MLCLPYAGFFLNSFYEMVELVSYQQGLSSFFVVVVFIVVVFFVVVFDGVV